MRSGTDTDDLLLEFVQPCGCRLRRRVQAEGFLIGVNRAFDVRGEPVAFSKVIPGGIPLREELRIQAKQPQRARCIPFPKKRNGTALARQLTT